VEALEEVKDLNEEGRKFKKFGFKPPPEIVNHLPHNETFGLESMFTQLHDFLENGDSRIIGIWGQGGIGKTTLLHALNNDLEKAGDYQVLSCFLTICNLCILCCYFRLH
jgi:disease resistance protein RPS2